MAVHSRGNLVSGHTAEHGAVPDGVFAGLLMEVDLFLGHSLPFQRIALLDDLAVESGGHIDGGHQEKNQDNAAVGQCFLKNGFHIVRFFYSEI